MITSLSNPTIVAIRKLHLLKERRESQLFLAEGLRVVGQALDSGAAVQQVIYALIYSSVLMDSSSWKEHE